MELKPELTANAVSVSTRLNRTFYGIETTQHKRSIYKNLCVLIVPFMELKPRNVNGHSEIVLS